MTDEDRGRGKYAGREPDPERMTPEEGAQFRGPLVWLTLPETDVLIDALEAQATALADAMRRTTSIPPRVREKYATTLSLLTAALEYRANYFRGIPPRPRADAAWAAL